MSNNGFNNQAEETDPKLDGRKFQAMVVFNDDPARKQRIKVVIPNLLEGETNDLPWIGPAVSSSFGMTGSAVTVGVPVIGAIVSVTFQDGDLQYGMYEGSLHTERSSNLGPLETNYPSRRGWIDPAGNTYFVDITDGEVLFHLKHKSGTTFDVDNEGNVTVHSVKDVRVTSDGNIYLN